MLDYLYTFEYDYSRLPRTSDWPPQVNLQGALDILAVYILADKYDVPGLRVYCRSIFVPEAAFWFDWHLDGIL